MPVISARYAEEHHVAARLGKKPYQPGDYVLINGGALEMGDDAPGSFSFPWTHSLRVGLLLNLLSMEIIENLIDTDPPHTLAKTPMALSNNEELAKKYRIRRPI